MYCTLAPQLFEESAHQSCLTATLAQPPQESVNRTQQRYHPVGKGCQGKLEEISPRFNFIDWLA